MRSPGPILLLALLFVSCSLPWQGEPADELNLNVVFENNLLYLPSVTIHNHEGRYFFGSAHARSVFDPALVEALGGKRRYMLQLSEKETMRIGPVVLELGPAGDAILGADAWGSRAVTVDYHAGLLTWQKSGIEPGLMSLFRFRAEPAVVLTVDGRQMTAIVDTASPDTLILPGSAEGRGRANVSLAGTDFGSVDIRYAPTPRARIGNRLLSKFLVTIDYGAGIVGLWRDPRTPL